MLRKGRQSKKCPGKRTAQNEAEHPANSGNLDWELGAKLLKNFQERRSICNCPVGRWLDFGEAWRNQAGFPLLSIHDSSKETDSV